MSRKPLILGVGGTVRADSTSELALRACLRAAEAEGAETVALTGPALIMPMFDPREAPRSEEAQRLVALARRCDGVVIASPGYHGSVSGLIKNALDYTEDMNHDARPYFEGRAVGCIACAAGWQAGGNTLAALRAIVHALRGWPTPLGVIVNSTERAFDTDGRCIAEPIAAQLRMMAGQIVAFARAKAPDRG